MKFCFLNLEKNIVDKTKKLSNVGFSMECFTVDFSQFCHTTVKICFLSSRLSTSTSVPNISEISLKFRNFLIVGHSPFKKKFFCFNETLHKKWTLPLRISAVNVTFLTFTEENLNGKLHFLCCESPLKMIKNAIYFTLKSSFHSQDI